MVEKQGPEGIDNYWAKKNQKSIDGFETEIIERSDITGIQTNNA